MLVCLRDESALKIARAATRREKLQINEWGMSGRRRTDLNCYDSSVENDDVENDDSSVKNGGAPRYLRSCAVNTRPTRRSSGTALCIRPLSECTELCVHAQAGG